MNEITKVVLENEMDLVLAHKQCMRLAELSGLSLPSQTIFATAVSEISRNSIGAANQSCLILYVSGKKERIKFLTAVLEDKRKDFSEARDEGLNYAKKLVQNINVKTSSEGNSTKLNFRLPAALMIDDAVIEKWRSNLNIDPAISPYEELKRKNRQLVDLADKLRASEQQYRSLTDSLPIMIFSTTAEGIITYANKWVYDYTGETPEEINETRWRNIVHPDDFDEIWANWELLTVGTNAIITPERRFKQAGTGAYRWHTGVSTAIYNEDGTVRYWNTFMVDIHAQKVIEQTLKDNVLLKETQVALEEKVDQLNRSNHQLEQFAYIASHDLQEPLRKIGFYSDFLNKKYGHTLPDEAGMFFNNLLKATDRMKLLIQDVLTYSTVKREGFIPVDLNEVAAEIIDDLEISINEKSAKIDIADLPVIDGNPRQLKQLFENMISNALKFSKTDVPPVISVSAAIAGDKVLLSFKDDGIGFEEKYINKMFDLFQQLHTRDKYKGTGIGLAICKKIADMHGGDIAARGIPGEGAEFLISLPQVQNKNKKYN